jgi:DNA-binding XRE family transcriptional regulator
MEFKEQIICRRKQMGLSQEDLGNKIGVTRQTVSKWELGETTPDMDKLIQLSQLFGASIDELTGNDVDPAQADTMCLMRNMVLNMNHYEYKSKTTIHGIPLVHINTGSRMYKAHGIIAIGNLAKGVIAIGLFPLGIISVGIIPLGFISLGSLAFGVFSAGAIAAGLIAVGAIAFGLFAVGAIAIGIYSLGGVAIAERIARGGYANAAIAIGDETKGDVVFDIAKKGQAAAIKEAILNRFPKTWNIILKIFAK